MSNPAQSGRRVLPPAAPTSKRKLQSIGQSFLRQHQPERLSTPGMLDWDRLEKSLARRGTHLYPAPITQPEEGLTYLHDGQIMITIWEHFYDALFEGGPDSVRANATAAHEVSHSVLHRGLLELDRQVPGGLPRLDQRDIPPCKCPEWQAFCLAGCILAPPHLLEGLRHDRDHARVGRLFGMSGGFMRNHRRRYSM